MAINEAALQRELRRLLEPHAFAGGAFLVDALSHEGSGIWHDGNPRRSSTADEYPAPQTEALVQSIDVRYMGDLKWEIGIFEDQNAAGLDHAVRLESDPPERGGRPFLEKALADPGMHRAILTGQQP